MNDKEREERIRMLQQTMKEHQIANPNMQNNRTPTIDYRTNQMKATDDMSYGVRDLNRTNKEYNELQDEGIVVNQYTDNKDINTAKYNRQSGLNMVGNFLMQAGVGEIALGISKGFVDIADAAYATVTNQSMDDFSNPVSKFFEDLQNNIRKDYEIYEENPNANFAFSDPGWVLNGLTTMATTASLLIPGMGYTKAIGLLGKIGKGKGWLNAVSKGISKTLAKGYNKIDNYKNLNALNRGAGKIHNAINNSAEIGMSALISRTAENYMEGREVYNQVYEESLDKLNNMDTSEFAKFANNEEFKNKSKEEIAKIIANKSATETFAKDYWMLLMDIPQLKGINNLWGKTASRTANASQRIAVENVKRTFAGKTENELIKNNFKNRLINNIEYGIKHPHKSPYVLELSEGVEEIYQGIQSQKGIEVSEKIFDDKYTPRSLQSYLQDSSIWEQGFWGWIGGIGFQAAGKGLGKLKDKIDKEYHKKKMSAEEFEKWNRSIDEIRNEQITNFTDKSKEFISNMEQINSGVNPFEFEIDKETGQVIVEGKGLARKKIDETQQELLKAYTIDKFITDTTLQAVNAGNFDIMKDIMSSEEFDKYLQNNNTKITNDNKAFNQQMVDKMNNIRTVYEDALLDMYSNIDEINPFIATQIAQNITRNKLMLDEYEKQINTIDDAIEQQSEGQSVTNFEGGAINTAVNSVKQKIQEKIDLLDKQLATGLISKEGYNNQKAAYERIINNLTEVGSKYAVDKSIVDEFNKMFYGFPSTISVPKQNIQELINKKIESILHKAFTISDIPVDKIGYEQIYDEFARANEKMYIEKLKTSMNIVQQYLIKADDYESAKRKVLEGNTEDAKVNKAIKLINYGYGRNDERGIGYALTNGEMNLIFNKIEAEKNKVAATIDEAEKDGVELDEHVEDENTDEENTDKEENDDNTDEEINTDDDTNNTDVTNPKVETNTNTSSTGEESSSDFERFVATTEEPSEPQGIDRNKTDAETLAEQASKVNGTEENQTIPQDQIDAFHLSEEDKKLEDIKTEINGYIWKLAIKQRDKFKEILEDTSGDKYKNLVENIKDFLNSKDLTIDNIEDIINDVYNSTITIINNSKLTGNKQVDSIKYASNVILSDEELDEIITDVLNEYAKVNKVISNLDGQYIINIKDFINYFINNIDQNAAIHIYTNLSHYITNINNNKFIFVGYDFNSPLLTTKEFFDKLLDDNKIDRLSVNELHIHPVEKNSRDEDLYELAITALANGAKATAEIGTDKYGNDTNINFFVTFKIKNEVHKVKIGILRNTYPDDKLDRFFPFTHNSGFKYIVNKESDGSYGMNTDFLFEALINRQTPEAKRLFNIIYQYHSVIYKLKLEYKEKKISAIDFDKALKNIISKEDEEFFINSSLIQKLIKEGHYLPNYGEDVAITLINKIGGTLIFRFKNGEKIRGLSPLNMYDLITEENKLRENYQDFKQAVYNNYKATYAIYQELKNSNPNKTFKMNVSYELLLNQTEDKSKYFNISDIELDADPNSSRYNPIVMVNENNELIGENGEIYGVANSNLRPYTMGFLVDKHDGKCYVASCANALNITNMPIVDGIRAELKQIIEGQLNNIDAATHDENYDKLFDRLLELFENKSLFRFNNNGNKIYAEYDSKNRSYITIKLKDGSPKGQILLTLFKNKIDTKHKISNPSNGIGIYQKDSNNASKVNNYYSNTDNAKKAINELINFITQDVKINRSINAMQKKRIFNTPSNFINENDGNYNIVLGGKTYSYKNYAQFVLDNQAFSTNTFAVNHSHTRKVPKFDDLRLDIKVQEKFDTDSYTEHSVTDLVYNTKNKRKSVNSVDVLKAAGVSQDSIDLLLGNNETVNKELGQKVQIITKNIYISDGKDNASMFYDNKDGRIYITPHGAMTMNNHPVNALRLLIHENIHRQFGLKNKFNAKEKDRIFNDLKEVYQYTLDCLKRDLANGTISTTKYNNIINVFNTATKSNNEQTQMEEFLVECLTQPEITNYLNTTAYKENVDISNINNKHKSIFQKIIDIILKIFNINAGKIENNSILAKEYLILSKEGKVTSAKSKSKSKSTPTITIWRGKSGKIVHKEGDIIKDEISGKTYTITKISDNGTLLELEDEDGNKVNPSDFNSSPVEEGLFAQHNTTTPVTNTTSTTTTKNTTTGKSTLDTITGTTAKSEPINTIPEKNEKLEAVVEEFNGIRKGFEDRVKRSDNFDEDHTYYVKNENGEWVKVDYSVTQLIHGGSIENEWKTPATKLGNSVDEGARIYFDNNQMFPEGLVLPNYIKSEDDGTGFADENTMSKLAQDLDRLHDYLDNKFGKGKYHIVTQEFPLAGMVTVNKENKYIAGTMDMLILDENGNYYIYDFKTKRADSTPNIDSITKEGYYKQVNIYKELLEKNYPQLVGRIKLGGLIKFSTKYPEPIEGKVEYKENPKVKDQIQIKSDNTEGFEDIQDSYETFAAPYLANDLNSPEVIIPVPEVDVIYEFDSLPEYKEEEKSSLDKDDYIDAFDDLDNGIDGEIDIDSSDLSYAKTELIENDNDVLLAPNGKPSNLTPKQYWQVRTKEFKDWFGDWENDPENASKVLDENGEPLVVYHTVSADHDASFNIFDTEIEGRPTMIYHTDDREMSFSYVRNHKKYKTIESTKKRLLEISEQLNKAREYRKSLDSPTGPYNEDTIINVLGYKSSSDLEWIKNLEYQRNSADNNINSLLKEKKELESIIENPKKIEYIKVDYINIKNPLIIQGNGQNWDELSDNPSINNIDIVKYNSEIDDYTKKVKDEISKEMFSDRPEYAIMDLEDFINEDELNKLQTLIEKRVSKEYPEGKKELESTRSIEEKYRNSEYDGIIFKNITDYGGGGAGLLIMPTPHNVFAVKKSNQIKSATDNNGQFSKDNDDIRYANTELIENNSINEYAEEWSKKEGWSINYFMNNVLPQIKDNNAWQIEYKLAPNQNVKESFTGVMSFDYNNDKREEVKSTSTIEAIRNGERTATTRYTKDGHLDYWKQAKVGDVIKFYRGSKTNNFVKVIVTKPLHKLNIYNTELIENNPNDYILNSGGAEGADNYWGKIAEEYNIPEENIRHREHPNYKAPHGNITITADEEAEGRTEIAKSANRIYGYKYSYVKNGNLIRDWTQVKYSDGIFAIGKLRTKGTKWSNNKTDDRVLLVDSVIGGTAYAVNSAILHNKQVYVYNQENNINFKPGWYKYDYKTQSYVPTETPTLTNNFAGIGTRELSEDGKKAIEDVYNKTFGNINKVQSDDKKETEKVTPTEIKKYTPKNTAIEDTNRKYIEDKEKERNQKTVQQIKLTSAEIASEVITRGNDNNAFAVQRVNDIADFIDMFPKQYQENIKLLLDSNELNYICK